MRILILLVLALISRVNVSAQVTATNYYVVIGEFRQLGDTQKLTDEANLKTFNAHFVLDSGKQHYYVYLLQATDQKKAKAFLKRIRKETDYKKARLYKGNLGEIQ